jgi:Phage terminase large subunit (GpA)
MNTEFQKLFLQSIQNGLSRKTVTSCSKWAEKYRIIGNLPYPGPWRFKNFPWLKEMHDSNAELNIAQKSSQMGVTETLLNIAFYAIDIKRIDVLYTLPAKTPDAGDFSQSRFDAALELSKHLENLFSDTKNVGLKRAGSCSLYVRGSRSRSGLKSVPVGLLILDELDEMTQKNIPLALERTAGQLEKNIWMCSTPTLEGRGINKYFNDSSQNHFYFKCLSCNRFIDLKYPDSIEFNTEEPKKTRLLCTLCRNTLPHESKIEWLSQNQWIESYSNRDVKGWYINHMYSTTITPASICEHFIRSQNDLTEEQEFFNSGLGLCHEVEGARITDKQINDAKGAYKNKQPGYGLITMGVDVGNPWIHVEIDEWHFTSNLSVDLSTHGKPKVICFVKIRHFYELDELMRQYKVSFCIIDASPERRLAFEFASRWWGRVRLCFYVVGLTGKQVHISDNDAEPKISVDRTSWLDLSLGRFRSGNIMIPGDVDEEYCDHLKAPVRIYDKDKDGNPIGMYSSGNAADHYAHARNYAEIALPLAISIGKNQTVTKSVI